ncbi:MAG TPA: FxsA family protein [bacterium]|nr:FxsA family protein [bacterium]
MILRTLIILFIGLPLLELLVLLKIGELWGAELTILLVLTTGIAGAFLAKSQGISVWNKIHRELSQGRIPGDELLDGLMIFTGGITLLTPGLITDTIGLCLLIPPTRSVIKLRLKDYFRKKVNAGQIIIDQ